MASLRYLNQSGPFWDFVNSFEDSSSGRTPWDGSSTARDRSRGTNATQSPHVAGRPPPAASFEAGPAQTGTQMPFRGTPSTAQGHGLNPGDRTPDSSDGEQEHGPEHGRNGPHGAHGHHAHGRGGHRSGRGRHGGRGGPGFGWGRPGCGGPPPPPPFGMGGPWNMNNIADFIGNFMPREGQSTSNNQGDFVPAVDVFDTEASYVVHVSLPGAKKEDTGVSWDPETSELSISGVIYRPGNEDFLKTLALDERKVGPFERKVRLGSRANPAQIDMDRISAKLEDGVLRVDVPKEDKDFVEVKKVDVQ